MKTLWLAAVPALLGVWAQPIFSADIPPHLGIEVPGIHAYTDWPSVPAGGVVRIRASASVPYRMQIVRLGGDIDNPAGDRVLAEFTGSPRVQPIYPGSYVHIEKGLPADEPITDLTLETWMRPWSTNGWSALIGQYDYPAKAGYGLLLLPDGKVAFYLGDGGRYRKERVVKTAAGAISSGPWYHVVATWDGSERAIWINGEKKTLWTENDGTDVAVVRDAFSVSVKAGAARLRLGAYGTNERASWCLNGDLAMPTIYNRALTPEEIAGRYLDKARTVPTGAHVLATWPLDEENGDQVRDVSGNKRHGRIVNHGQWMIGGPSFRAWDVPRFSAYKPSADPTRGHSLRLSSDDLQDSRWETTHEYRLPDNARPGMYAARFTYQWNGEHLYHVTFLVRGKRQNPILVLAATNTWTAYNNTPFARPIASVVHANSDIAPFPQTPNYSFYRDHVGAKPAYYIGTTGLPNPYADPYLLYSAPEVGYSHLARAERFFLAWMDQTGYRFEYDMASDLDLHQNPNLLDGYAILVIQGHSEYWSDAMSQAVDTFLKNGGSLVNLSGNTDYWRVGLNADASVMQARKFGGESGGAGGRQTAYAGELWHSGDQSRGGLMREAGFPAWKILGLETGGWWNPDAQSFGAYTVELPEHFLFTTPNRVNVVRGSSIGRNPSGGLPMAVGHEADVRLSTILGYTGAVPAGASVPQEPEGIVTLARSYWPGFNSLDYFGSWAVNHQGVRSEMIYWERPEGGRVFNAGSIGFGWTLSVDPELGMLLKNVFHHFGVPEPVPAAADFNGDWVVDMQDFLYFATSFGSRQESADWRAECDLDGDGAVGFADFLLFAQQFGNNY